MGHEVVVSLLGRRSTHIPNEQTLQYPQTRTHTLIVITIIHLIIIIVRNRFNILRMERQWIQSTVFERTSNRPMVLHSILSVCFHSSTNRHVHGGCNWITYRSVLGQLHQVFDVYIYFYWQLWQIKYCLVFGRHILWNEHPYFWWRSTKTINQITKTKTRTLSLWLGGKRLFRSFLYTNEFHFCLFSHISCWLTVNNWILSGSRCHRKNSQFTLLLLWTAMMQHSMLKCALAKWNHQRHSELTCEICESTMQRKQCVRERSQLHTLIGKYLVNWFVERLMCYQPSSTLSFF